MEHVTRIQGLRAIGCRGRRAFTLVELLVVVGIIALLISMLLPALNKAREASKTTVCLSHLQQISVAMSMYVNEYRGWPAIPYYSTPNVLFSPGDSLFPYGRGYQDLLSRYTKTLGCTPDYKYNYLGTQFGPMTRLSWDVVRDTVFGCPSDNNEVAIGNCGSYSYNIGLIWTVGSTDWTTGNHWRPVGTYKDQGNTALLVCGGGTGFGGQRIIWYAGDLYARRNDGATGNHNKGTNILFCDGHAAWAPVDMTNPEFYNGTTFAGYRFDPNVRMWPVNIVWDPTSPTQPGIPRGRWHIP